MSEALAKKPLSWADYLALEQATDTRHEYLGGEAWERGAGPPRHSALVVNVAGELYLPLRGRPFFLFESNLRLYVEAADFATYADLVVVAGRPVVAPHDPNTLTNPTVLVEVLSPSTAAWDRGGKFAHYQRIPSLQHFVLVDPAEPRVELYTRQDDGSWRYTAHGPGTTLRLDAIDVTLAVDPLYEALPD